MNDEIQLTLDDTERCPHGHVQENETTHRVDGANGAYLQACVDADGITEKVIPGSIVEFTVPINLAGDGTTALGIALQQAGRWLEDRGENVVPVSVGYYFNAEVMAFYLTCESA